MTLSTSPPPYLRLKVDLAALCDNWRAFARRGGTARCAAVVKADGYGLGAVGVVTSLIQAGCRDFFVASWAEAAQIEHLMGSACRLHVLSGPLAQDMDHARASQIIPVINSLTQAAIWRDAVPDRPCAVMVDTGMNRLGLDATQIAATAGLNVTMLMSHLACADDPAHPLTAQQLARFRALDLPCQSRSLANSAGVCLGTDYAFDMTRVGIGLYGGIPHPTAQWVRPVVHMQALVLGTRWLSPGDGVGYGNEYIARQRQRIATLGMGYADGLLNANAHRTLGSLMVNGRPCALLGRVSMDLTAIDLPDESITEGDWVTIGMDLPTMARQSKKIQYELLVRLGSRYQRIYA